MPTADECRKYAEECKRLMAEAADEFERESLARIAREWNGLAEHKAQMPNDDEKALNRNPQ